jgi:CRISPR-associated protein Cas1
MTENSMSTASSWDRPKGDDLEWAERCQHWASPIVAEKRRGAPPRRTHKPLVLTGHGLGLRVEQGTLLVRDGFTHYPQVQAIQRFFPGDRNMPSRIVIVDGNGNVTLDALGWLAEQNVPLVRIDWRGNITTVIGNNAGPDHRLVRAQLAAQGDKKAALKIATSLIVAKLTNSVETLRTLPPSARTEKAIAVQLDGVRELKRSTPKSIGSLIGLEGKSAQAYFAAWQGLPLRWKGIGRKPIPNDWRTFAARTSLQSTKPQNRNASHPVNAMLNYAYAVLESRVRSEIVANGYDPMIGYLHSYSKDRAAFVFDLIEPLRPVVDQAVLDLVRSQLFEPADFTIGTDGVCRLNPELAKLLVARIELLWPTCLSSSLKISLLSLNNYPE